MTGPILFIGDSVTDCGRRDDAPDFLGDGYVRMIADRLPDHHIINAGISGNRAIDLCTDGDPICSRGRNPFAHSDYVTKGYPQQAASYVAGFV